MEVSRLALVTRSAAGRLGTGLLLVALLVSACATVDELPTQIPADETATPTSRESNPASLEPTASAGTGDVHVGPGQRWSIVVPHGWELAWEDESSTTLIRGDQASAEILNAPASGLSPDELEAQSVESFSTWPGVTEVELEWVRLPAGSALRATFFVTEPVHGGPMRWIFYTIEDEDTQYHFMVWGRGLDDDDLVTDARALAESFVILD